ncbi:MAG: F0F1 ATP synthase subunit A [Hyphomicrobiales bacterium]|nr:F0F1 ATP synthase subunit A [Hyphomicrobiales bacterium]
MANDPIHQFQIQKFFSLEVGGVDFGFTNSSLFMAVAVTLIAGFLILATSGRGLVPTRMQSVAELLYEFIAGTLRSTTGAEGMRFFPFVFSLFAFVLICNLLGMFPYFFTVTSHIIVTFALAMLVITVVIIYGVIRNGAKFLKLFVPSVPAWLLPLLIPIEIISFVARPLSLSIRLFANMLAGHITLKVFAGFVVTLSTLGFVGVSGAVLPFLLTVALTALEFLVAFLQAYVFATLTCIYINDALHPGH